MGKPNIENLVWSLGRMSAVFRGSILSQGTGKKKTCNTSPHDALYTSAMGITIRIRNMKQKPTIDAVM